MTYVVSGQKLEEPVGGSPGVFTSATRLGLRLRLLC